MYLLWFGIPKKKIRKRTLPPLLLHFFIFLCNLDRSVSSYSLFLYDVTCPVNREILKEMWSGAWWCTSGWRVRFAFWLAIQSTIKSFSYYIFLVQVQASNFSFISFIYYQDAWTKDRKIKKEKEIKDFRWHAHGWTVSSSALPFLWVVHPWIGMPSIPWYT